jgi:hypothetical protein
MVMDDDIVVPRAVDFELPEFRVEGVFRNRKIGPYFYGDAGSFIEF